MSSDTDAERDAILAALTPVVDGIAATFGPVCDVVLHDYRKPGESVVAVAGSVTGRAVGGAMSEIGMRVLARGDEAEDELNYVTRTRNGTLVKSSTMVLRDSTGAVFGALCVNVDVSAVTPAAFRKRAEKLLRTGHSDVAITMTITWTRTNRCVFADGSAGLAGVGAGQVIRRQQSFMRAPHDRE